MPPMRFVMSNAWTAIVPTRRQRLGRQLPCFSRPASKGSNKVFQCIVSTSPLEGVGRSTVEWRDAQSHLYSTNPIKNRSRPCDGGRLCIRGRAQCQGRQIPSELHARFPINHSCPF